MNRKLPIILSLFLCVLIMPTYGQEAISSSGGEATGSGGSSSYTLGQVFYSTNSGSNGLVSEGVQQPYEIYVISSIEETDDIKLKVSVYPNPTSDYLILDIGDYEQNLVYQIYDLTGNLLQMKEITGSETKIELGDFNSSIYFLKLINTKQEIKTFKIIKN